MVYFRLKAYIADDADDVEAHMTTETVRLGVVVNGRKKTPTFLVVDGFLGITIQAVATGLHFYDDQCATFLCHDV